MANGTAAVTFTVPADAPEASTVVLTAQPSGTTVRVPLTVTAAPVTPPSTPPTSADESAQTPQTKDGITVPDKTYHPGDSIVITVGAEHAGEYVSAWLWSTPVNLGGWQLVGADGKITVTLPADIAPGTHRIVVQDAEGTVIGWTEITVAAAPSGGGTGNSGNASAGGKLANTGSDLTGGLLGAGLVLLAGAGLILVRKRRTVRG
jgi:5'-nucleotidase